MNHGIKNINTTEQIHSESGFSIIESLFVLLISSLIMGAIVSSFISLSRFSHDNEIRVVTQLKAQGLLDMITPDIRMIGNGVPFQQSNFLIAQATLSDNTVTQPILANETDEHKITFRINETGETYILDSDFNPNLHTSISLANIEKIKPDDNIYITNFTIGMDDGLWGLVSSVSESSNSITLQTGSQYHPGAIFPAGSLLEVVPIITYNSEETFGKVTRDNGSGALELVKSGILTFEYRNSEGNKMDLPLVASSDTPFPPSSIQNVHTIKVTAEVQSENKLIGTSDYYRSKVSQIIGVRNLNYKY